MAIVPPLFDMPPTSDSASDVPKGHSGSSDLQASPASRYGPPARETTTPAAADDNW